MAYLQFLEEAAAGGHAPSRITLGSYTETAPSLLTVARNWGLPPRGWTPNSKLIHDATHRHLPEGGP